MLREHSLPLLAAALLFEAAALIRPAFSAEVSFRKGHAGAVRWVAVGRDDSLVELARRHDVGYNEIVAANPGVDPFIPDEGTPVLVPSEWLLPDADGREGIVVNLAEFRLYYLPPGRRGGVETFPIGIGDEGSETPLGAFRVVEKIVNPAWHVPRSIREQQPELPDVVPPGPDNPLGTHALRLSLPSVLIHGTDRPFGIGRRVSHGCIHLYPEDIGRLFARVTIGTSVTIVAQPVKATETGGRVLVEVHAELGTVSEEEAREVLWRKGLEPRTDTEKLRRAVRDARGIPVDVTGRADAVTD